MSVVLTVRDVPEEVRDALAASAKASGRSLQAYLLSVLSRQAGYARNAALIHEVSVDIARLGGVGFDAPPASEVLAAERERTGPR